MVRLCVLVLLVDSLSPHEDFGFTVQRECAVVFPEAVKQLHVFKLSVLVTHCKHTHAHICRGFSFPGSLPAGAANTELIIDDIGGVCY